jgi:dTDP-4-amino-4,6-dideoxygalactose transaminase
MLVRDAGIDRTVFRDEFGEINPACDITVVGHSATIGEINSYIGTQQMQQVHRLLALQRANALHWDTLLKERSDIEPLQTTVTNPNYWVYGTLTKNKQKLLQEFRSQGYYASGVHINNNHYSVFGDKAYLKGVSAFYNNFLALPAGWWYKENF